MKDIEHLKIIETYVFEEALTSGFKQVINLPNELANKQPYVFWGKKKKQPYYKIARRI